MTKEMVSKAFDDQERELYTSLINRKYFSQLRDRSIDVWTEHRGDQALVTVTLKNDDESFFYPIEAKVALDDQDLNFRDGVMLLLDFIESYLEEYFKENENIYIPIDWQAYEFEDIEILVKGQVLNLELERRADQFLANAHLTKAEESL